MTAEKREDESLEQVTILIDPEKPLKENLFGVTRRIIDSYTQAHFDHLSKEERDDLFGAPVYSSVGDTLITNLKGIVTQPHIKEILGEIRTISDENIRRFLRGMIESSASPANTSERILGVDELGFMPIGVVNHHMNNPKISPHGFYISNEFMAMVEEGTPEPEPERNMYIWKNETEQVPVLKVRMSHHGDDEESEYYIAPFVTEIDGKHSHIERAKFIIQEAVIPATVE